MGNETKLRLWLKRNKRSVCTAGTAAVIVVTFVTGALLERFLRKVGELNFTDDSHDVLKAHIELNFCFVLMLRILGAILITNNPSNLNKIFSVQKVSNWVN